MTENSYRTGQAAKLLSTSSHHIRKLCEAGIIDAELTEGNQWKIPNSEIERMREEGLPPIPHQIERTSALPARSIERNPPQLAMPATHFPDDLDESDSFPVSDEVQAERDNLSTAEIRLKKRKVELEHEGVEDSFREREKRKAAELEAEKRREVQAAAETARKRWANQWLTYAHSVVPSECPGDVRLEAYRQAATAVNELSMDQSVEINQSIVDAALAKVLTPYVRGIETERAINAAVESLPYDARGQEGRARKAAEQALSSTGQLASYWKKVTIATAAIEPIISEFNAAKAKQKLHSDHETAKTRLLDSLTYSLIFGNWNEKERDQAKDAVKEALDGIAPGAPFERLEKAKAAALAPLEREVKRRLEREEERRQEQQDRLQTERTVDAHLSRVDHCLSEYDFDTWSEKSEMARDLKTEIRPILVKRILFGKLDTEDLDDFIDDWVDAQMDSDSDDSED